MVDDPRAAPAPSAKRAHLTVLAGRNSGELAVAERIRRLLEQRLRLAVLGVLNRREHPPLPNAADH